jgi:two-component system NtrC family sensor kinase
MDTTLLHKPAAVAAATKVAATKDAGSDKLADLPWVYALYELGQTAATGVDPLKVQQDILLHIVSGLDAESGSIAMVVDGTDNVLEIVAGTDLRPGILGSRPPPGTGIFGHVIATGQPLLINGAAAQTGLPVQLHERPDRARHSAMCWPLRVRERTIGVLAVNRAPRLPRYTVADLDRGQVLASLLALVMANHTMHVERETRLVELSTLNAAMQRMNSALEDAQYQVIQTEKLASIGQMAAGVAHEINNPIAFVLSNLGSLESYVTQLLDLADACVAVEDSTATTAPPSEARIRAQALREKTDLAFLRADIAALIAESHDGLARVRAIVADLKSFARGSNNEICEMVDLRAALESTLNIVRNEVKYKAEIETHYEEIPDVEAVPSRLNQVFLNLLVNAAQSITEKGRITITTGVDGPDAWVRVADDGCGIPKENLARIFEPFFTTKPVGQGTGLGLSVSNSIVRKHGGRIEVESEAGRGSRFTVYIPLHHTHDKLRAALAALN